MKQHTLEELLENINSGKIKTLFCLESDLLELAPDREAAIKALSRLDSLIVQTSRQGEISRLSDVVISSEPFYRKQGSVLNAEGRLLSTGGNSTLGFDALSSLAAAFGRQLDFGSVQKEVLEGFGLNEAGEFAFRPPVEFVSRSAEVEVEVEAEILCSKRESGQEVYSRSFSGSSMSVSKSCPECFSASLVYSLSPFMWHGIEGGGAFVELNLQIVRRLGLTKGGTVKIRSQENTVDAKFRVSSIEDGYLLSPRRLRVAGFPGVKVELTR